MTKELKSSASSTSSFEQAIQGRCFIKIGAVWCGPCKQFAPIFDDIASKNPQLNFVKVDSDDDVKSMKFLLSQRVGGSKDLITIKSVPKLLVFYKGKHLATLKSCTKEAMQDAALLHFGVSLQK